MNEEIRMKPIIILPPGTMTDENIAMLRDNGLSVVVNGTPLQPGPTKEEREQDVFDSAKLDELRRLAREEAKAERAAAKAAAKGK